VLEEEVVMVVMAMVVVKEEEEEAAQARQRNRCSATHAMICSFSFRLLTFF